MIGVLVAMDLEGVEMEKIADWAVEMVENGLRSPVDCGDVAGTQHIRRTKL